MSNKCSCGNKIENPTLIVKKKGFLCDLCKIKYLKNNRGCIYEYYGGNSGMFFVCGQKRYKDNLCYYCYNN